MNTTSSAAISAAPATIELSAILCDFCDVRNRLDAFYESANGEIFKEYAHDYHLIDNSLGEVYGSLFDVMGYYMHDDFAKSTRHE